MIYQVSTMGLAPLGAFGEILGILDDIFLLLIFAGVG
jgi:hypothetical protein